MIAHVLVTMSQQTTTERSHSHKHGFWKTIQGLLEVLAPRAVLGKRARTLKDGGRRNVTQCK